MVWIGSVRCEKFRLDFVAQTFALIAPIWHVLQQVLCSSIMIPNAPKQKETHQNLSSGSNCVDRVCRFREILPRLCGTNSCINSTRLAHLHRVSCNSETVPNAPKRKETHQNMSLGSNGVDRDAKNSDTTLWQNFCINCTSMARFAASLAKRFQMHPNGKKRTKTCV